MIYTGPVDEFFDYRYGKLPYRSLEFQFETLNQEWSSRWRWSTTRTTTLYTRVTEFKHLTGQEHAKTSDRLRISAGRGRPLLPGAAAGERRAVQADTRRWPRSRPDVHFVGRLATYKYYNMDQVVAQALSVYARIVGQKRAEATRATSEIITPRKDRGQQRPALAETA